ncbi:MAG: hypothetical protein KME08_08845 [Aphanothece sp. CMT-3BRIN-NPC111]|nr:hypothetical protein [Aphanothece sp. CMT-3BRIN-NPC111]
MGVWRQGRLSSTLMAAALFGLLDSKLTMLQFWRAVARLGRFINSQSDGEPRWQALWHSWQRLPDICWGAAI